ncbi:HAD family hydrolase [Gaiella sp.]|uniref:HAD family hydrolase n=1 Tax=Gaiella sp. TaxID=2663207 RepID=UPI002E326F31|nr:HAD family hydrolase [Gaiella sp.]HEX5585283.1 HAD family hydrolase [Gaiella sp.]
MTTPRAIFFDLDDTLIDRDRQNEAFAPRFQEHFAEALPDMPAMLDPAALIRAIAAADLRGYRERTEFASLLQETIPWRTPPSAEELLAFWWQEFPRCSAATEGLYEVLGQLRGAGYRLGIITNGIVPSQSAKIEQVKLRDHVDDVVISGAVGFHKPDPRIFHHALGRLEVTPEQAWFVGDNPINDVRGAEALGITAVWFQRDQPWPADLPMPRRTIRSLRELLPMIDARR